AAANPAPRAAARRAARAAALPAARAAALPAAPAAAAATAAAADRAAAPATAARAAARPSSSSLLLTRHTRGANAPAVLSCGPLYGKELTSWHIPDPFSPSRWRPSAPRR